MLNSAKRIKNGCNSNVANVGRLREAEAYDERLRTELQTPSGVEKHGALPRVSTPYPHR
nr:hypothetical protein [Methylomarinum sp. Ch1-1]MDP4519878.1 hypothetical protein [Methylomarinum sp. Ch1-1]